MPKKKKILKKVFHKKKYLFFTKNFFLTTKRVVIYGAGALGRKIYKQLNNVNDIQVVGVVDRNYAMLGQVDGYTVESPDVIGKINFDIIIIAVLDEITAEGIKKRLEKEYGISAQYMAWYGNYVDYSIGG